MQFHPRAHGRARHRAAACGRVSQVEETMSYTCFLAMSVALAVPYAWGLAVLARATGPRPASRRVLRVGGRGRRAADAAVIETHGYDPIRLAAVRAAIRITD